MIQPEDIRRKAENLYEAAIRSWLDGKDNFFPRVIPSQKKPDSELTTAIMKVQKLRQNSKEVLGYGYSVKWQQVNSRKYGRNSFPEQISFETIEDLLRFIQKKSEFAAFTDAVTKIRNLFPQLEPWIESNIRFLTDLAPEIDGLVEVVRFLQAHPRPDCFIRELPLAVDTKFVEQHQGVLRQWLDILLPPHCIRADEEHFERRFGLRYAEPHLLMRFLDPEIQKKIGFPCDVLSLPLHTVGQLPLEQARVIIVENKVNLLTIPRLPHAIGIGALGKAVSLLRYVQSLSDMPITYWGDIDIEGFEILSDLRAIFPHTQSMLMDQETLLGYRHLTVPGTGQQMSVPVHLTSDETNAFHLCLQENLRLEQERLPQKVVLQEFERNTILSPTQNKIVFPKPQSN